MNRYKSKSKRTCEVFQQGIIPYQWYFHVKRRENGQILAHSEGYKRKIDCLKTAKLVTGGRLKISIIK